MKRLRFQSFPGVHQARHLLQRLAPAVLGVVAIGATAFASADDYSDQWGPAIGSALPVLEAYDQSGALRTLDNLAGDNGLLLFLNRSADW